MYIEEETKLTHGLTMIHLSYVFHLGDLFIYFDAFVASECVAGTELWIVTHTHHFKRA